MIKHPEKEFFLEIYFIRLKTFVKNMEIVKWKYLKDEKRAGTCLLSQDNSFFNRCLYSNKYQTKTLIKQFSLGTERFFT